MRYQLLVYFLALTLLSLAYSDYSFFALAKINEDGSAHVTEKSVILFETPEERKAFELNMNLGESTMVEWRRFSNNIRYHFKGNIANTKITAKREFAVSFDAGAVIVEYDVGELFTQTKAGSRRTIYSLSPDSLSFDRTKTGQISLGNNVELDLEYPKDAEILTVAPLYEEQKNKVIWRGPIAGNWEFSFAREIALSKEVSEFFIMTYGEAVVKLPLILLTGFSLLVLFVLVKVRNK
jgi:hypothetical protein